MNTTSASLLERLRAAGPAATEWGRVYDIYVPFIRGCLRWSPGLGDEIDDVVQDVLVVLVRELPRFCRQRDGSFRSWLRQVTVNQVRAWRRARRRQAVDHDPAEQFLTQLEDPASRLAQQWDREHDKHVFDKLLALVRPDCEPPTWEAFRLFAIEGRPAAEVAAVTGLSAGAVMSAKSRILKRLREEAAGLLDE